ncbi:MAG: hypothetical protein ACT4PZ_03865 [Panacagrimonas sp.]
MSVSLTRLVVSIALVVGLAATMGCARKQVIDTSNTESIIAGVNKGDNVRITTKNDIVHKFTVTKITNKALYGDKARVVYDDMQKIEVMEKGEQEESEEKGGFWSRLF